jgi:hypothetical protein
MGMSGPRVSALILLLGPALVDASDAEVDRQVGGREKTSEHTPIWIRPAAQQPLKMRSRSSRRNEDDE